jgi:hypothetical protein
MTPFLRPEDPAVTSRDRALRTGRRVAWTSLVGALGLSGVFSVVAARTVKGHTKPASTIDRAASRARATSSAVQVPAPQRIPSIAGLPAAPRPPAAAPTAPSTHSAPTQSAPTQAAPTQATPTQAAPTQSAPAPAPAPTTSGGS